MPFKELARIALLGTENAVFTDSLLQEIEAKGMDVEKDPPLLLAEAAAVFSQIKKAGFKLEDFKGKLPEASLGTEENACSFKSVRHLQLILDGKFSAIFPEFLNHLLENGKHLPTSLLPSLMARSGINEWWHMIEVSLSDTGKWLLAQHPKWCILVERPDEKFWETGDKFQRTALFRYWRMNDPLAATEHLGSAWDSENYRGKKLFIKELAVGLSSNDEPILEKALQDRRKEVRREAVVLLAKLPLSEYSERMFQRALDMLFYEKGKWHFNIPDEPDKKAVADGILAIDPSWKGGTKAGYLGQIFSKIPPSRWELHFEADPQAVLKLFTRTDWSNVLLRALANAAVFHGDDNWAGAMVTYWFENENSPLWNDEVGQQLLELTPPDIVNRLCMGFLQKIKGLPEEESPRLSVAPYQ